MLRPSIVSGVLVLGITALVLASGNWPLGSKPPTEAAQKNSSSTPSPGSKNGAPAKPSTIAVETAIAKSVESSSDLRAIGSLQSDESVQISSEIAGRVTELPMTEGGQVAAGDVLVKLDDALVAAEVADTQARFDLAEGNLGRANTLARTGNVTGRARDEATANSETARAAVELAKVRLAKHTIRAPFPGVVGIRKVSPGAYVAIGQPIVNIEKIDALKVDFKLPEVFLAKISVGQPIEVEVDALPGRQFPGTIYAIDPHIDVNGRALSIRARLPNGDMTLRPGLFVRINVKGAAKQNVLAIPESAVVPRGQDKIIYVVANGQAGEVKVKLGTRKDGMVEVLDGLEPGAIVVTAGQQKLKDGSAVEVLASGETPRGSGS